MKLPERGNFIIMEGQLGRSAKGLLDVGRGHIEAGDYQIIFNGAAAEREADALSKKHPGKTFLILDLMAYAVQL
jgi:hypothetical protein